MQLQTKRHFTQEDFYNVILQLLMDLSFTQHAGVSGLEMLNKNWLSHTRAFTCLHEGTLKRTRCTGFPEEQQFALVGWGDESQRSFWTRQDLRSTSRKRFAYLG